uniref:Uncharacterized protein n=1 Tax=Brassica oleracea TaxID=3712 RepID=A0A3P6AQ11_BRAOL|nr:unnamed protein product [Brassica oleracea]
MILIDQSKVVLSRFHFPTLFIFSLTNKLFILYIHTPNEEAFLFQIVIW